MPASLMWVKQKKTELARFGPSLSKAYVSLVLNDALSVLYFQPRSFQSLAIVKLDLVFYFRNSVILRNWAEGRGGGGLQEW